MPPGSQLIDYGVTSHTYAYATFNKAEMVAGAKVSQLHIQGPFTGKPEFFFFTEHLLQTLK